MAPKKSVLIKQTALMPIERIASLIFLIRNQKVMLDKDLAILYGVSIKRLNEQVKRNIKRFPSDFMFQLTKEETVSLRSQIATLEGRGRHRKYLPYAFTEQGVAMLSSVLNSERAIRVNIQIMRTFTKLRQMIMNYAELQKRIENMERKFSKHNVQIKQIFAAIKQMLIEEEKPKKEIGFRAR